MYKILFDDALVAEQVDAADLKSVGIYPVPVQVRPSAPIVKAFVFIRMLFFIQTKYAFFCHKIQ